MFNKVYPPTAKQPLTVVVVAVMVMVVIVVVVVVLIEEVLWFDPNNSKTEPLSHLKNFTYQHQATTSST